LNTGPSDESSLAWTRTLVFAVCSGCADVCRAIDVDGARSALLQWPLPDGVPHRSNPQNTSSYFTRQERISLAQGAVEQLIAHGFPPGTMARAVANFTPASEYVWSRPLLDSLVSIGTISRKDFVSGTRNNQPYVEGELQALMQNDTESNIQLAS
jgi:hypothetical protein